MHICLPLMIWPKKNIHSLNKNYWPKVDPRAYVHSVHTDPDIIMCTHRLGRTRNFLLISSTAHDFTAVARCAESAVLVVFSGVSSRKYSQKCCHLPPSAWNPRHPRNAWKARKAVVYPRPLDFPLQCRAQQKSYTPLPNFPRTDHFLLRVARKALHPRVARKVVAWDPPGGRVSLVSLVLLVDFGSATLRQEQVCHIPPRFPRVAWVARVPRDALLAVVRRVARKGVG
jgi:hypothetical protein